MEFDCTKEGKNIYFACREKAAKYNDLLNSRERAAELLGISTSTLANHELGVTKNVPPDTVVMIAFADLWWQLEQHLECWCVQREPEQSTFQLEHEHRLPLRSTLICQNRKLQGLPTVRGDKGTCFHSG